MQVLSPLRHLVDFCYPRICAACDAASADCLEICPACERQLQQLTDAPACRCCAMPLAQHDAPCPHCMGDGAHPFERIVRLGIFVDPLRGLVHHLKYHGRWTLADLLATRLVQQKLADDVLREADVIVPVPLHPWRQMSRGYNQAELLARCISRRRRITLSRAVVRLKNTETQTHLHSKAKRLENLRDAFGLLRPKAVRDKHVVVVDDVMTTGATLHSMAGTLMQAEPASLCAMVLAVADPRRRGFEQI